MKIKLSKYSRENGFSYQTGLHRFHSGLIPGAEQDPVTKSIYVDIQSNPGVVPDTRVVIYARVSSHERKEDLSRQIERCKDYAAKNGYKISAIYKEIASGMNDNRPKFWEMLSTAPTVIICENKDRLTRFGFNYIERLLSKLNCSIDIMYPNDGSEQDIMKDMISILTSFCCRLYGARRGQNKALRMKKALEDDADNS